MQEPLIPAPNKIHWPFFWPALALSGMLLAVVIIAALMLHQAHLKEEQAIDAAMASQEAYAELEKTTQELRHQLDLYAAKGDETNRASAEQLQKRYKECLIVIERWVASDVDKGHLVKLQNIYGVIQAGMLSIKPDMPPAERQNAVTHLVNDVIEPEALHTIHKQHDTKHDEVKQVRASSHLLKAGWWLMLLGILGSGGGLLAGYSLARRYQKEIMELSVPIHNAAGSLSAIVGPIHLAGSSDIQELETSLKGIAQQVAAVVERLQSAERENVRKDQMAALGQLAAGLAHELRNPLTAIKTLIEAAKSQKGEATLEGRDLEVIEEEITRLNKTLQAFLDYARPPKLEKSAVDFNQLTQKTQQLLEAQAEQRSIQIKLELSKEPVVLQGDPEQLKQVLINLSLNAFDAVGTHGTVTLQTESTARAVILRVKDTGPGIPEKVRGKLFEPFVSSKVAGTGLGLTICKRIVEEHGGTITAENVSSGGACFTVTLPLELLSRSGL